MAVRSLLLARGTSGTLGTLRKSQEVDSWSAIVVMRLLSDRWILYFTLSTFGYSVYAPNQPGFDAVKIRTAPRLGALHWKPAFTIFLIFPSHRLICRSTHTTWTKHSHDFLRKCLLVFALEKCCTFILKRPPFRGILKRRNVEEAATMRKSSSRWCKMLHE